MGTLALLVYEVSKPHMLDAMGVNVHSKERLICAYSTGDPVLQVLE
jgi:hypothetical protein